MFQRGGISHLNKFWEELIAYSSLIRHGPHRKQKNYVGYTDRHANSKVTAETSFIFFLQNKESRLKILHHS
jgi:hypothetical protein